MPASDVAEALRDHPFLRGLPDEHLATLLELARPYHARPGDLLLREGDPSAGSYLLLSGRAAVEVHAPGRGPMIVDTIAPGGQVGWSWLVPPHLVLYDVIALDPLEALVLDGARLRGACEADPVLGYALAVRVLGGISSRLAAALVRLLDLYGEGR